MRISLLPVLAGLCACGPTNQTGNDVQLIAVLPLTGDFAVKGQVHENAVRLALEDLVEAGAYDIMDRTFNVLPVNSGDGKESVEEQVRTLLNESVGKDIMGMISSTGGAHEGSAPVALEYGIAHFETSSGSHDEEFIDPSQYSPEEMAYLMSARALCNYEAIKTAEFIAERWPTGTLVQIRADHAHDLMHTRVIRATLRDLNWQGTLIDSADPDLANEVSPDNRNDFLVSYDDLDSGGIEDQVRGILDTYEPDLIFFHVRGDSANSRLVEDLERAGYMNDMVTCGMARKPDFIDPNKNGQISDWLVGDQQGEGDGRFYFVMRSPLPSTNLDNFKERYNSVYEDPADTWTAAVYDAAMLWGLGVVASEKANRANVLDGIQRTSREGTAYSFDQLSDLLVAIAAGEDVDYDGASGAMDMRDDRTVPGSYYIERIINNGDGSYDYEELASPVRETL